VVLLDEKLARASCNEARARIVVEGVIDELTIGRRYILGVKSAGHRGRLEGRLRSTRLPRGVLGNEDGEHSIWVSGESFEWFLRPDEIESAHEVAEPDDPEMFALLPARSCERPLHPSRSAALIKTSRGTATRSRHCLVAYARRRKR
jgi:hypothetical protein